MTDSHLKPRNNRALTFEGANRIFEVVGIEITQHPTLDIYEATYREQTHQAKTLIELSQQLILAIQSHP
ncbi:MAG: hypothetical protein F6J95_031000 [Leptolyngbya sp. SIO1E4]|nr:hypothetical protein [Leptolyngbya sp. SIO1E4]